MLFSIADCTNSSEYIYPVRWCDVSMGSPNSPSPQSVWPPTDTRKMFHGLDSIRHDSIRDDSTRLWLRWIPHDRDHGSRFMFVAQFLIMLDGLDWIGCDRVNTIRLDKWVYCIDWDGLLPLILVLVLPLSLSLSLAFISLLLFCFVSILFPFPVSSRLVLSWLVPSSLV